MNPIDKIIFSDVEVNSYEANHNLTDDDIEFDADVIVEFNNKKYTLCYELRGLNPNQELRLNSRESGDDYDQLETDVIAEYCDIEDWDVSDMYQEINDKFVAYAINAIEDFNTDSQ